MPHKKTVAIVICIAGFLGGIVGAITVQIAEWAEIKLHRELREWFAVKAVDEALPVEILKEIHKSEFTVAQILALIQVESDGRARAVSSDGRHVGVMMVKLSYARKYGYAEEDLYDPVINVSIGLDLLRQERVRYKDVEYYYISGYNCKKSTMEQFLKEGKPLPRETRDHWARYRKKKRQLQAWLEEGEWRE